MANEEAIREELPGVTTARLRELMVELSLLDIGRLMIAKAAGPEGLSQTNARQLDMASSTITLSVRMKRLPKPAKKASKR